jgi:hypothetical protein
MNQTEQHRLNSAAARQGKQAAVVMAREAQIVDVRLVKASLGWQIIINKGHPMPATDAEVSLWLQLQEARAL